MAIFLDGAAAMGCMIAALFFARFWRRSGDRLFVTFAMAFGCFSINYALLGLLPLADETRPFVFLVRLIGFVAILWGIVHRNWGEKPGP